MCEEHEHGGFKRNTNLAKSTNDNAGLRFA